MRDIRILCAAKAAASPIPSFAAQHHTILALTPARTIKGSKSIRQKLNSPAHLPVVPDQEATQGGASDGAVSEIQSTSRRSTYTTLQQIHKPHPRDLREVKKS
jgi:hypothetical protein